MEAGAKKSEEMDRKYLIPLFFRVVIWLFIAFSITDVSCMKVTVK
jgi:hypothetical protein